jgi:dTDP-4-amino-4,6-dideoxygalactose transaminase
MVALRAVARERQEVAQEVVVPSFTYIASVSAILWAGFTPVFVDVDPDHWHVTPSGLLAAIRSRGSHLACAMPCSTFGTAPPIETRHAWEQLGREAGLPLVVDSAAGFGSIDEHGRPLGQQGDAEVFSFHATKPFAVGEGGIVVTRRKDLAERMKRLVNFGLDGSRRLDGQPGLNAKLSEPASAIALAVLDRFDRILHERRRRAQLLVRALEPHGFVFQRSSRASTWQFVPTLAPRASARGEILERAACSGVELRTYHEPLHHMEPLREHRVVGSLDVTEDLASRILSLPMANTLDEPSIELVRSTVLGNAGT